MNQEIYNTSNSIQPRQRCASNPDRSVDASYQLSPACNDQHPAETIFIHPISSFSHGLENYLDPKFETSLFSSHLPRISFPNAYGMWSPRYGIEPAFVRKRNERERLRVKCVNEGYTKLRQHLPENFSEKRLCKVETLRCAIDYISYLENILGLESSKLSGSRKKSSLKLLDDKSYLVACKNDSETTQDDVKKTQKSPQKGSSEESCAKRKCFENSNLVNLSVDQIFDEDIDIGLDFNRNQNINPSSYDFAFHQMTSSVLPNKDTRMKSENKEKQTQVAKTKFIFY